MNLTEFKRVAEAHGCLMQATYVSHRGSAVAWRHSVAGVIQLRDGGLYAHTTDLRTFTEHGPFETFEETLAMHLLLGSR